MTDDTTPSDAASPDSLAREAAADSPNSATLPDEVAHSSDSAGEMSLESRHEAEPGHPEQRQSDTGSTATPRTQTDTEALTPEMLDAVEATDQSSASPDSTVASSEHLAEEFAPEPSNDTDVNGSPVPDDVTPSKPKSRKSKASKLTVEQFEETSAESSTEPSALSAEPAEAKGDAIPASPESKKKWYVVKVQSGREESIKSAIERKVKIEGLEEFYNQIAIPVEEYVEKKKVRVTDKKTGEKVTQEKNVTKARKKYPGYLFAEVEFNENILYLFRETSGVGDFVGATGPMKPPPPMSEREVQQMLTGIVDPKDRGKKPGKTVIKLDFEKNDKVRIREGAFANMEGEVKSITEPKDSAETPKVTVVVSIFGRPVDVELDYWQVDKT